MSKNIEITHYGRSAVGTSRVILITGGHMIPSISSLSESLLNEVSQLKASVGKNNFNEKPYGNPWADWQMFIG